MLRWGLPGFPLRVSTHVRSACRQSAEHVLSSGISSLASCEHDVRTCGARSANAAACAAVTQPMRPENEEYAWLTLWMLADAAATSSAFEHEGSKQNVPTCHQRRCRDDPTVFARGMRIGEGTKGRMQASCGISACATSVRNPCCFAPVRAAAAAEPFANAERQTSVTHSAHNRTHSSGRNGSRAESASA